MVYVKYFDPTGSWTWYALEGEEAEEGDFLFFGYVVGFEAELGYFTLGQLKTAKQGITGLQRLPIERDLYFKPCLLSKIKNYTKVRGDTEGEGGEIRLPSRFIKSDFIPKSSS
jgi:hypothetical protein